MKYLTHIDLCKNELQNAVIQLLATAPATPKTGQIYYNTTDKTTYQYDGTKWNPIGGLDSETKEKIQNLPYTMDLDLTSGNLIFGLKDSTGIVNAFSAAIAPVAPLSFAESITTGNFQLKLTTDTSMSATSTNPVQNKVVKNYIDNAIENLPADQFLDLTKTTFVQSFAWSNTTYPGSTNPNLNGKPVLVMALKDENGNIAYSFINLEDLIDVYTGTSPITVSGNTISHANSGVAAGSKGPTTNTTPEFGETFIVPQITVDEKGHITAANERTITIPDTVATMSKKGLMSADDKDLIERLRGSMVGNYLNTMTISAGETTVERTLEMKNSNVETVIVNAYIVDSGTYNPVMIDHYITTTESGNYTVHASIAQPIADDIEIFVKYNIYEYL